MGELCLPWPQHYARFMPDARPVPPWENETPTHTARALDIFNFPRERIAEFCQEPCRDRTADGVPARDLYRSSMARSARLNP